MLTLASSEPIWINYYALVVSIIGNCIPETAFEKIQSETPSTVKNRLSDEDFKDMAKMREEGMFLKDIGEIYGIDPTIICRRLKKLQSRNDTASKKGGTRNEYYE